MSIQSEADFNVNLSWSLNATSHAFHGYGLSFVLLFKSQTTMRVGGRFKIDYFSVQTASEYSNRAIKLKFALRISVLS